MNVNGEQALEAVGALKSRGVDNGEQLLTYGTPEQIHSACRRWDRLRDGGKNVGPGLLAKWIREREFPEEAPPPANALRARFDEYAARYAVGSTAFSHAELLMRRYPGEAADGVCDGHLIVVDAGYPVLELRCDKCEYEAALTVRQMAAWLDG